MTKKELYMINAALFGSAWELSALSSPPCYGKRVKAGPLPDYKIKRHNRKKGK